jgi:hypothetical protein
MYDSGRAVCHRLCCTLWHNSSIKLVGFRPRLQRDRGLRAKLSPLLKFNTPTTPSIGRFLFEVSPVRRFPAIPSFLWDGVSAFSRHQTCQRTFVPAWPHATTRLGGERPNTTPDPVGCVRQMDKPRECIKLRIPRLCLEWGYVRME